MEGLLCLTWRSAQGIEGSCHTSAIIITATELVVGPLTDPVISLFDEKVEIRVRMMGSVLVLFIPVTCILSQ